jgi:hypothetical protein
LRESVSEALEVRRRAHGVHGMVLAIRDALARGDAADQLAAKIDDALDAASKHLAERGYSQHEIDAAVSRFRDRLAREIDSVAGRAPASDAGATGAAQRVAVAEAAREVKRERFSLDILTAEGDRVSIRFKSLQVTEAAVARVSNGTAGATAFEANVISRGRFKVEVDGNLNEAERAAIGDLLDEVDGIAKDFFGGDVEAAFAAAARVGLESDALSAFSLRLSYSKSTAVAKAYASTAALTDAPALTPVASTTTDVPKVADVSAADPTTGPTTAGSVTAPAPVPVETPAAAAPAASASRTIANFTKDVLARLATAGTVDSVQLTLRWKMEFMLSAMSSVASTPAEQAATDALGQALDSSAA